MTPEQMEKIDAGKESTQPKELRQHARRIRSYIKDAKDGKVRKARVAKTELIEDLLYLDNYWVKDLDDRYKIQIDKAWYPKNAVLQMILEEALPKVMNDDFRPTVTVEESKRTFYPSDTEHVKQMQKQMQQSGLAEERIPDAAAEMLNTKVEIHREKIDMDDSNWDLARNVLALGEHWVIDGYSKGDGAGWKFCNMKDVFPDPHAKDYKDIEYVVYRFNRSIRDIRAKYPEWAHLVKPGPNDAEDDKRVSLDDTEHVDSVNVLNSRKNLYCCWERSTKMVDRPEISTLAVDEIEQMQQLRERDDTEVEDIYALDEEQGVQTLQGWKVTKSTKVPEYPSGWRQIIICDDICLDDGTKGKLPKGAAMPVRRATYLPIEGSVHGRGLLELALDNAQVLNQIYKSIVEDIDAGPVDIIDSGQLQGKRIRKDKKAAGQRRQTWYLDRAKGTEGSIRDIVHSVPAGETSQSALAFLEAIRQFTEWLTGINDPSEAIAQNPNAPAELVKQLDKRGTDRAIPLKRSIKRVVRDTVKNWCHYFVTYETEEQTYTRRTFDGESTVRFAPYVIGQFDYNFDVKVGYGSNLPEDEAEAAVFLDEMINRYLSKPKPIRDIEVHNQKFPFEKQLIEALDQAEAMIKEEQAAQQPPDPAMIEARKAAAKSIADSLEEVVKDDMLPWAYRQNAIGLLLQIMNGQIPDETQLSEVFASLPKNNQQSNQQTGPPQGNPQGGGPVPPNTPFGMN